MNVLLTGASGLLGRSILKALSSHGFRASIFSTRNYLSDLDLLKKLIADNDVVIHCAAFTDVEKCEVEETQCWDINFGYTSVLADLTKLNRKRLVFISSTGVYGKQSNEINTEEDECFPSTQHHKAKYAAEKCVLKNENGIVLRVGWLFGVTSLDQRADFVISRIQEIIDARKKKINLKSDIEQIGNPTYTHDVSKIILKILSIDARGVFNCVNKSVVSRYEYVKVIASFLNYSNAIVPVCHDEFLRNAPVSMNESASCLKIEKLLKVKINNWHQSLKLYIEEYNLV